MLIRRTWLLVLLHYIGGLETACSGFQLQNRIHAVRELIQVFTGNQNIVVVSTHV